MTDMNLAWLTLSKAPEGTPEKTLSELLRRRGINETLRGLDIDRLELARWVHELVIPDAFHAAVCELYRVQLRTEERAGVGRINVDVAVALVRAGVKQDAVAADFGVSKQAVSKALKKARKKAAGDGS